MKKIFLGLMLGIATGAAGYKLYKENENDIKDFLGEHLSKNDDINLENIDIEELEELRGCIDEMIDVKLKNGLYSNETCYEDAKKDSSKSEDDDYICIVQSSNEKEEN